MPLSLNNDAISGESLTGLLMQRLPGPHLTHHVRLFPHRSPRRSSANAAEGGLKPPPEGRLRRAGNPSSLVQHRFQPPIASGSLQRSWHTRFFQKRVLELKLADTALQFPDSLAVGHIGRQRLPGEFPPVCLYPEPECGIVDIEFARYLRYRPRRRGVDHFLDGLLLQLRSVMLWFSRHFIPFLSGENPIGSPVRKIWGTSVCASRCLPAAGRGGCGAQPPRARSRQPVTAAALARALPAAGEAAGFAHVLDGAALDGTSARLAAMLDRALLEEAGWDPVT